MPSHLPPTPILTEAPLLAGHWKLRHTPVMFAAHQVVTLAQMSLFTLIRSSRGLYQSFGFHAQQPVMAALLMFQELVGPVDEVSPGWGPALPSVQGGWVHPSCAPPHQAV